MEIEHLGFCSADPEADAVRLIEAGAARVGEGRPDDGSLLLVFRDSWGIAFQLHRRFTPLIADSG